MSINDSIKLTLQLKEENLFFDEKVPVTEEIMKGKRCLVYHAKFTTIPEKCPSCHNRCDQNIKKIGFAYINVRLNNVSNMMAYMRLGKQRFLCRHEKCGKSFQLEPSFVDKHCFISKSLKLAIWNDCAKKRSVVDIAHDHHVSHHTVHRIIQLNYEGKKIDFNHLPAHLCFDEFKSTKDAKGAMSFIYMDAQKHRILDILEDRRLESLIDYFKRFSPKAREGVKTVVIDMHDAYFTLIKTMFPNAEIITDRFHIVQLISRSLNITRIKAMKDKINKEHYKKLKRYWKLLLKNESELNNTIYRRQWCFKVHMTSYQLAHAVAGVDEQLKLTYHYYQDLLHAISKKNKERLLHLLENAPDGISEDMRKSVNTLLEYLPSVLNALDYPYSNGPLEGTITTIKYIKRTAFGYRSFYNLKARILLIHEFNPTKIARLNKKKQKEKSFVHQVA